MDLAPVRFARDNASEFSKVVRARVRAYFQDNDVSKHANAGMVFKTVFMLSLFFVPYTLMMTGVLSGIWGIFLVYGLMGFGMAGIGLSIMHDANHGAYSKNARVNSWLGKTLNLVGGYAYNWKVQHNVLHHTFTNIDGYDEDIAPGKVLRFSPHARRYGFHRFQHVYAWFFYGVMTLSWNVTKDFKQLVRYRKMGFIDKKDSFGALLAELILWRVVYFSYALVLPMIVLDQPWWIFILSYLTLHFIAGLVLASIFQPAHVVPHTHFPIPEDGNVDDIYMVHQLKTTANFAPRAKLLSWYVGGLNYQVEHHLFPHVCHVHYPKISRIVKETAEEFGLPYYSYDTFRTALYKHILMLRDLGKYDMPPHLA